MEQKIKHLEMIQSIINQIANHSFMIRGWSLTLVSILFALTVKEAKPEYVIVAYIPIPVFWLLDGFFFSQERAFRGLYNRVRSLNEEAVDFSMNKSDFSGGKNSWFRSTCSKTLSLYYLALVVAVTVVLVVVR